MSSPVSSPPMPAKCAGYGPCRKPKHYKSGQKLPLYKNTTDLHAQNSGNESTVDATTGESNLTPLHATGSYSDGIPCNQCGDYSGPTCVGTYNGDNCPVAPIPGYFCGPWTARPPINTFAAMEAALAVSVTGGGTGYTDGALLTAVVGYSPGGGDDRAPTFRIKTTTPTSGICATATIVDPGSIFTSVTAITTATGGGGTGATFSFTVDTMPAVHDFGACNLVGWAAVCSMRYWHGMTGFNNPDGVPTIQCNAGICDGNPLCSSWGGGPYSGCEDNYEPDHSAPPSQNKYLALTLSGSYVGTDGLTPLNNFSTTDSRVMTINEGQVDPTKRNGELILDSGSDLTQPGGSWGTIVSLLSMPFTGLAAGLSFVGFKSSASGDAVNYATTCGGSGTTTVWGKVISNAGIFAAGTTFEEWGADFDPSAGTNHFYRNEYTYNATPGPVNVLEGSVEETLDITETSFTYTRIDTISEAVSEYGPPWKVKTFSVTGTLSTLNTSASVNTDAEANYAPWLLLDRTMLPLQTRNWDGIIPKVSRNEVATDSTFQITALTMPDYRNWTGSDWGTTAWKDMRCWSFVKSGVRSNNPADYSSGSPADAGSAGLVLIVDGSILGQPLPLISGVGIPLNYFDSNFQDYEQCYLPGCADLGWLTTAYLHEYGNWNSYRVTQQTNKWEASQIPFGRARLCGPQFAPLPPITVTKSIQTAVRYPSYNNARPFGKDRWLVDELHVGGIAATFGTTSFTGSAGTLGVAVSMAPGDVWSFWATGHDGTYHIDTVTGLDFTCTFLYALPSGFTYWDTAESLTDDTKGIIFKFRMPSCPPFGGRLAVQSVTAADDSNGNHPGSHAADPGQLPLGSPVDYIPTCTIVTEATAVPIDDAVPSGQTFTVDLCGSDMTALASNLATTTTSLISWAATTAYVPGQSIKDSNNNDQTCIMPGNSGGSAPTWGNSIGDKTLDGSVLWQCIGTNNAFKVTETYATIATAKWVVLYGALEGETTVNWSTPDEDLAHASHPIAHWYWCYDGWQGAHDGVGNMVKGEWTKDFRTAAENSRLLAMVDCNGSVPSTPATNYGYDAAHTTLSDTCKGWVSCGPWLIVCSPHAGDTPPTGQGVRLDFASGYVAPIDERYGSAQYVDTFQGMLEPLYQTPHAACGGLGTTDVRPTCVPIVEARMILPGSTGSTVAPDGGGGASLTEVPPVLIDYTMLNPATHSSGNLALPPSPGSQPDSVTAPTGVYPTC
jgi:hypothetical protein